MTKIQNKIKEFKGEYYFLSNFYPHSTLYEGKTYPSSEHAYMSAKSNDPNWKFMCQSELLTPSEIKAEGRKVKLIDHWDEIKFIVMENVLKSKFSHPLLKHKLLQTSDLILEEGNDWGDKIWGIDNRTGEGENHLGKTLMRVRDFYISIS